MTGRLSLSLSLIEARSWSFSLATASRSSIKADIDGSDRVHDDIICVGVTVLGIYRHMVVGIQLKGGRTCSSDSS